MWIMTSWGILMPGLRPPGTIEPGDVRTLQVRARRRRDLDILRVRYMPNTLGPTIHLKGTDYEYRAYCTPESWGTALAMIGAEIDYVKFKETAESRFGDKQLHNLYVRLWGVIFDALSTPQHRDEYWGVSSRSDDSNRSRRKNRRRKNRHHTSNHMDVDWSMIDDRSDAELDDIVREFDDILTRQNLQVDGDVIRRANGTIDHSFCDHANTKNARRRCQRKHNIM